MHILEEYFPIALKVALIVVIFFPLIWWASSLLEKRLKEKISPAIAQLMSRILFYVAIGSLILYVLPLIGIQTGTILGAAGVLGIGVGFAAQTSLSNIISGVFLVMENSFEVGDKIMFNDKVGTIDSINLFSVNLHTDDNKLFRIPNESLLKNPFINLTYFPKRRLDIKVTVTAEENAKRVVDIINSIITHNDYFLTRPAPFIALREVKQHESIIDVQAWANKSTENDSYNNFEKEVKKRCEAEHIVVAVTLTN